MVDGEENVEEDDYKTILLRFVYISTLASIFFCGIKWGGLCACTSTQIYMTMNNKRAGGPNENAEGFENSAYLMLKFNLSNKEMNT